MIKKVIVPLELEITLETDEKDLLKELISTLSGPITLGYLHRFLSLCNIKNEAEDILLDDIFHDIRNLPMDTKLYLV